VHRAHGFSPFRRHGRLLAVVAALGGTAPLIAFFGPHPMAVPDIPLMRAITTGLALAAAFALLAWPAAVWCERRPGARARSAGGSTVRHRLEGDVHGSS
jgi:hypothetical protein